jgi:hypothetical protein
MRPSVIFSRLFRFGLCLFTSALGCSQDDVPDDQSHILQSDLSKRINEEYTDPLGPKVSAENSKDTINLAFLTSVTRATVGAMVWELER